MDQIRVFVHHRTDALGRCIGPTIHGFLEPPLEIGLAQPPWRQSRLIIRRASVCLPLGADVVPDWGRGSTVLRWTFSGVERRDDAAAVLAHADAGRYGFSVVCSEA